MEIIDQADIADMKAHFIRSKKPAARERRRGRPTSP
jgi:hypothetical protein